MIQDFVTRFMAPEAQAQLRAQFASTHPEDYAAIVKAVVEIVGGDEYDAPDPTRIHTINDGDYQGTLVFVIAAKGYQPSRYWYVKVGYGSCSGCDTLAAIRNYGDDPPTDSQIGGYMTLALHVMQGMKEMSEEES